MILQTQDYVLLLLLVAAVYFDLSQKKIPNYLTLPVIAGALLSYTITGRFSGFLFSFYGLLAGIVIFFIPFALGGMGGGDVKLMGAVGSLMGLEFVLSAALWTALAGGVIAVIYLLARGKLFGMLKKALAMAMRLLFTALAVRFRSPAFSRMACYYPAMNAEVQDKPLALPYGVAIFLGTLIAASGLVGPVFAF